MTVLLPNYIDIEQQQNRTDLRLSQDTSCSINASSPSPSYKQIAVNEDIPVMPFSETAKLKLRRQSTADIVHFLDGKSLDSRHSPNIHNFEDSDRGYKNSHSTYDDSDEDNRNLSSHGTSFGMANLKYILLAIVSIPCIIYICIHKYLNSESLAISEAISQGSDGSLSAHQAPSFAHLNLIGDLEPRHVPGGHKHHPSGRLIIVGDVHGMKVSLELLLAKLNFDKHVDHLILAGDMISKGPDSVGVVQLAMDLGATGVRGNHEDRVLLARRSLKGGNVDFMLSKPTVAAQKLAEEEHHKVLANMDEFSHSGEYKDRLLAKQFSRRQVEWLEACPVILRVGEVSSLGNFVVVHGGLVPGVRLQKQDPYMVMNMRSIHLGSWVPSDGRGGGRSVNWFKLWNKYQKSLPAYERTTVVYGHDSKMGLQKTKYSRGIDTSCLKGGRLTAVVIGQGKRGKFYEDMVHVGCPDGRTK